ncbi:MAG TPA: hypothetical protein VHV27_11725 [Phenylobacterium sp.]|jgi:hypothetical protein|nr:hypothetical protein [Phenylobacterium sp.]
MPRDDPPTKPIPSHREAKLAQALRANLRRRKSSGGAKPPRETPKQTGSCD